jgi:RNA recognition motif-containing protein
MNMYVSNLSFNVTEDDIRGFFSEYGEVISVKLITDRETGRSRGFGFVDMSDDVAANKAMSELNGGMVDGRPISVAVARPREDKGGRQGGGRSFGNSRW